MIKENSLISSARYISLPSLRIVFSKFVKNHNAAIPIILQGIKFVKGGFKIFRSIPRPCTAPMSRNHYQSMIAARRASVSSSTLSKIKRSTMRWLATRMGVQVISVQQLNPCLPTTLQSEGDATVLS